MKEPVYCAKTSRRVSSRATSADGCTCEKMDAGTNCTPCITPQKTASTTPRLELGGLIATAVEILAGACNAEIILSEEAFLNFGDLSGGSSSSASTGGGSTGRNSSTRTDLTKLKSTKHATEPVQPAMPSSGYARCDGGKHSPKMHGPTNPAMYATKMEVPHGMAIPRPMPIVCTIGTVTAFPIDQSTPEATQRSGHDGRSSPKWPCSPGL
mmetsp:Transcript_2792/g.6292  ORF Transcript_2792/g.6292 Transcript_2792/m.6292 type:complete len:211 (-) Transcript_2792:192-824(-)